MPRLERERRYIAEYIAYAFPAGNAALNVPVGPIPDDLVRQFGPSRAAALFFPTRPRCDALAWTRDTYYVIESKVREPKAGIGDLLMYGSLIPQTPDLPMYDGQPVQLRLVVPQIVDWVRLSAHQHNIEVVEYWREWIADYWRERQDYFTRSYRIAREEKMRMRRLLGLE